MDLIKDIIEESLAEVRADKLLTIALEKEALEGDYHLLAIGKAACAMAKAARAHFGDRIIKGLVITRYGYSYPVHNYQIMESGHPYPDENSFEAGKAAMEMVERLQRGDNLLLLISGGASALAEVTRTGVSLTELKNITRELQLGGADIIELNTVRKHLSQIKGGQLAKLAEPARIYGFLLSDVAGDRPDTIGSGPAVPDKTTSEAAHRILEQYKIECTEAVKKAIMAETPRSVRNAVMRIIGNNEMFCYIAAEIIMGQGYIPWLLTTDMNGEARNYARLIPDIVKNARNPKSGIQLPCIAICGGETTVKVTGNGKGGRNQELALAAAIAIRNLKGVTVAALASDGSDGNTDNAGAVVNTNSYDRMLSAGINPEACLHNNDSATALSRIDAVIQSGATETNLNDILLILIEK